MRKNIIFMAMVLMCLATGLKAENIGVDDSRMSKPYGRRALSHNSYYVQTKYVCKR